MSLLSRLFGRTPKIACTVSGDHQTFDAGMWSVTLPRDWQLKAGGETVSIEASDRTKSLALSVMRIETEVGPVVTVADLILSAVRDGLANMDGYRWDTLQDDRTSVTDGCAAVLDVHDPERGYRICTKVIVRAPYAIRAAFHDYDCTDLAASHACFDEPVRSLKLRRLVSEEAAGAPA